MIEISLAHNLVNASDPLAVIWEEMLRRSMPEEKPPILSDYFERTEEALSTLERFVYETFFEAYDHLLERGLKRTAQAQKVASDFLFRHAEFVLLADSLSVREAALLTAGRVFQPDPRWEVVEVSCAVAPFPTTTETLAARLLGVPGPAYAKDTEYFAYRYVAGLEHRPDLPRSGRLLVWLRLPDTVLEEVTASQTHTITEVFDKTAQKIADLLDRSDRSEVLLTSDHGYLYGRSATQIWPLSKVVEDVTRSVFPRASRVRTRTDANTDKLHLYEWPEPERRVFVFTERHAAIRGRYWWGTGGPNDRCTAHGGLSFVEGLVPLLHLHRRQE